MADDEHKPDFDDSAFFDAAGMVYNAGGFDASQLNTPEARRLIAETVKQLNVAISSGLPLEVPEMVRYALENNAFIFSGFKAFHTLREVGLSLTTDKGDIKPFDTFRRDVEKVNNQYNHNYLYAEYNHAVGASLMAARWQQIEADGDRYDLQYRTAEDGHVRESHAILHGTTLPPSDPFWAQYLPPNGWNCRCTAVQVRKGKYPQSDPALSMLRGQNCTEAAKQQIFRFNPGKELKLFPDKHPYYKAPEAAKDVIEQQAKERAEHFAEYERLKADPNYTDVEFDPVSGGVQASHIGHNFDKSGGEYERNVQLAGFRAGHVVIFESEPGNIFGKKYTEGTWDGLQFEVAGRESATANNIKRGLEHCADKKTTKIAVLDFPNGGFNLDTFNIALRRYKGLEKLNDGQFLKFKKIICIQNRQIIHEIDM
ncbi:MAG: minor capsid protein [Bacteroidales bacterium]|nr:minor capsid protein [Bacteroidales bacterium]